MAVKLEGGCTVSEMREGEPSIRGTLSAWQQVGRATGAQAISLRVLEFSPGESPRMMNEASDEVFYFLEQDASNTQRALVSIDGNTLDVEPQTGIYLRPGQTMIVKNPGPDTIVFVSSRCPEIGSTMEKAPEHWPPIVRLADRKAMPTADRWYRVLVDDEIGSVQVTQFVGSIPPGRAPDHFHHYEEVLFILRGSGRMWSGDSHTPIGPGSCVYLPNGQTHCVENTGEGELRLLGVFYPAGSPAVRYES